MEIFWRLAFGHLLADFTFQTNYINRWKRESFVGLLFHCLMHPAFYLLLCWPYLNEYWINSPFIKLNGWICLLIIFITHFLEDWWRVYAINKYAMPDNTAFFLWDQIIHYSVIFAVAPLAIISSGNSEFFPEKWPVIGCLFIGVTHACTVIVFFLEKDLHGAQYPGFDEKYLTMAERLVLALCFLFPSVIGAAVLSVAWISAMVFLRRKHLFDLSGFSFYMGTGIAIICGLAARSLYY